FKMDPSPWPDVTDSEIFLFLGIIIQMGHDIRDRLKDYWSTVEQFATPFYSNTMKHDHFLHILRFLHFAGNNTETDRNDRLWKVRTIFNTLNDAYEKYNPSLHLAIDEIIVKFKGRVVFRQYIPKKHKRVQHTHMGYVHKADRMANSYSTSRRTWKWTNKLFFHLLDLTILNSFILLPSCGAKLSHREFRLALVRKMLEHAARGPPHWPTSSNKRPSCRVCSSHGKWSYIWTKCMKCDVGLCISGCFQQYHMKATFS
ncbi:hypothetical protein B7P43_G05522, partial [Cryptotermes secundus]